MTAPSPIEILAQRERYRDWYSLNRDPISEDRLSWQAQGFRHMVHLLPGETILEVGAGRGLFTPHLTDVCKGRNPITSVRFEDGGPIPVAGQDMVEALALVDFPGVLKGRKFRYVVVLDLLDRDNASFLLSRVFDLLKDGGEAVFFDSNPWNPVFAARKVVQKLMGNRVEQGLLSRSETYELISEIGFIRVSALFTDFVYRPLTPPLIWFFRNLSILLENTPVIRRMAGRILIHAQKPPRAVSRPKVSLATHEILNGAVSVVVPCHNEEMNIPPVVEGLLDHYGDYLCQIVLVDDNSTDGTRAVIEGLVAKNPKITGVFRKPPNGVGHALRDGYAAATGEYILSMDCDFQHLLPELEDMFDAAADGADAVFGSRFSRHSLLIGYPFGKIVANRAFHLLLNLVFRRRLRDLTNNLKLMRTGLALGLDLREPWFAVNAEIGLQLALTDCRLKEVPVSWINRSFDMGHSTFRVLKVGGGYARVLARLAARTWLGFRKLSPTPPSNV